MSIVISIQQRITRLQAQAKAMKTLSDESKSISEIAFVKMAEQGTIDEITATEHLHAFAPWEPNTKVESGALRAYGEEGNIKLYRCLQAHTTQSDWRPNQTPSLWKQVGNPNEEFPEWSQPIGAVDAYDKGAKVKHNGKNWTSDVANNVWEPGVYGWSEV